MRYRLILALACLYLQGCATLLPPQRSTLINPFLTAPCGSLVLRPLLTWQDLALSYAAALDALSDCQARHKGLAEAVSTNP